MKGITSVILMVAGFQIILVTSKGPPKNIPEQCERPPEDVKNPHDYCKIPPFFTNKDFEDCGFQKFQKFDGTGHHRPIPPDYSKQMCMLEKYGLLKNKKDIDHKALKAYMEQWAKTKKSLKASVAIAKEKCVDRKRPGPPQLCEANKLVFCISSVLFAECPVWQKSKDCQKWKRHFNLCKPYINH